MQFFENRGLEAYLGSSLNENIFNTVMNFKEIKEKKSFSITY
jgi:hypothetical protein